MKAASFFVSTAAFAWLSSGSALAQSDIYVCTDAQGQKTYQNTGDGKGCKKVDVQPVLTLPAPKLPANANRPTTPSTTPTPANFPRVDAGTQKARDSDRRKILADELAAEEGRLESLRAEYNNGEPERRGDERNYQRYLDRVERLKADIQRTENNIASLKRELALIASQ